jgi:hypothetical protein
MLRRSLLFSLFALPALADSTNLRYSTILGPDFNPAGISADGSGQVYVAANGTPDATGQRTSLLVEAFRPDGSAIYTRRIGVRGSITVGALAADAASNVFLAGGTSAADLQPNAGTQLGTVPSGPSDTRSFLMKLDAKGYCIMVRVPRWLSRKLGRRGGAYR